MAMLGQAAALSASLSPGPLAAMACARFVQPSPVRARLVVGAPRHALQPRARVLSALRAMMRAVTSATRGLSPEARGMEGGLTIAGDAPMKL